jgi:hypothetical protein
MVDATAVSESQPDFIIQPKVAPKELPWVTKGEKPTTLKGLD